MSVLKNGLAHPSRIRGIFRYLLQAEGQRETRENLEKLLSPEKLSEDKKQPHPMFNDSLREGLKCKLFVEEDGAIAINPELPGKARDPQLGDKLLPDTLIYLFFGCDNQDEEDFGLDCAWYLAQDLYESLGTWEQVEQEVAAQKVAETLDLKLSSDTLFEKLKDWMYYLGLAWGHSNKNNCVADPTAYLRRNLKELFQAQKDLPLKEFIDRLAKKCPLFETGKFRERVEEQIGRRQPNHLSTSTAFALFRLQDEGQISLVRKSDADLMILPKANQKIDNDSRISHIILEG